MMTMGKIGLYIVEACASRRMFYKREVIKTGEFELLGDFDNAEDCIEALSNNSNNSKNKSNIVLINLRLPYINGLEATKIISERFPNTKIIIITSKNNREELLASLYSGANGYVLNNTNFKTLKEVMKAVYIGAIWINPQASFITKSMFPKPNSTDFDNLYGKNDIREKLTEREYEVLNLIAYGKSNVEIGKIMMVSTNTAKAHVGNILTKLNVKDRVQAAVLAVKEGIV